MGGVEMERGTGYLRIRCLCRWSSSNALCMTSCGNLPAGKNIEQNHNEVLILKQAQFACAIDPIVIYKMCHYFIIGLTTLRNVAAVSQASLWDLTAYGQLESTIPGQKNADYVVSSSKYAKSYCIFEIYSLIQHQMDCMGWHGHN